MPTHGPWYVDSGEKFPLDMASGQTVCKRRSFLRMFGDSVRTAEDRVGGSAGSCRLGRSMESGDVWSGRRRCFPVEIRRVATEVHRRYVR
jgi:hypothetical protein